MVQKAEMIETSYIANMNIIITGASRGLGAAIAEKFAADGQGHTFFLCARNEAKLQSFAKDLQVRYAENTVHAFAADLGTREGVHAFIKWEQAFDMPIDILVNNAGQFIPGNVYDEPAGVLEKMIEVNLYSAYHLTRALIHKMMKAGSGHIFNMCSIASLKAYENGGAYSISKFALAGFSKNLREEMKPHNIKVTAVYPGAAFTDSWEGSGIQPQRIMESDDIAKMIYAAAHLSPQATVEDIILRPQQGDL